MMEELGLGFWDRLLDFDGDLNARVRFSFLRLRFLSFQFGVCFMERKRERLLVTGERESGIERIFIDEIRHVSDLKYSPGIANVRLVRIERRAQSGAHFLNLTLSLEMSHLVLSQP